MIDTSILKQVNSASLTQMATVLSMFLDGKEVEILPQEVEQETWDNFIRKERGKYILVEISFQDDLSGDGFLLMKTTDASIISNLIMGGEGEARDDLSDIELTAITETIMQMLSSYSSSLSSYMNRKISVRVGNISSKTIDTTTLIFPSLDKGGFILSKCGLKIGTLVNSFFYQLLPVGVAKNIVDIFSSLQKKELEEKRESGLFDLKTMQDTIPSVPSPVDRKDQDIRPVAFPPLETREIPKEISNIDLIMDVPLSISVELGRAKMSIQEILELSPGSVIELDKIEGEPVDVLANGRLIAKGEVVVIGEIFGVRLVEILSPNEAMKRTKS